MRLVDYILDHILDHLIISFITMVLQTNYNKKMVKSENFQPNK